MKKVLILTLGFSVMAGIICSCTQNSESGAEHGDIYFDEETEQDQSNNRDENPVKKIKYDLSVLSEECLEMLDVYEEMQAKIKDASKAAKVNRADQELQDKYYLLLQENTKLLADTRMVECSNDVNFQYAMSAIADKYYD